MPRLNLNFLLKLTILFLIVFIQTGQCENIEDRIVRLESIIEDLIMENKNLKKRVEELENTLEFTKLEKIKHYQLIHKHLKETRNKSNNSEDVKELHKDLPVSQGHTKQRLLKRITPVPVALAEVVFHAYLSADACYNAGTTLMFDTVTLNIGNAYTASDGIFVVPVSGVYAFSWTVVSPYEQYFSAELTMNGKSVGVVVADSGQLQAVSHATGFILLKVNEGDHVLVRTKETGGGCKALSYIHDRTTFSGFLLYSLK